MRKSWKEIAENLVVFMTREQMVAALNKYHARLADRNEVMDEFERQSLINTTRYLAECIAEYDEAV